MTLANVDTYYLHIDSTIEENFINRMNYLHVQLIDNIE
jgi:hypothetical protein